MLMLALISQLLDPESKTALSETPGAPAPPAPPLVEAQLLPLLKAPPLGPTQNLSTAKACVAHEKKIKKHKPQKNCPIRLLLNTIIKKPPLKLSSDGAMFNPTTSVLIIF